MDGLTLKFSTWIDFGIREDSGHGDSAVTLKLYVGFAWLLLDYAI